MSERSAGSGSSATPIAKWRPRHRYLLDNSLNPRLAEALRLAGWDIVSVNELFGASARQSILDPDIIPRCAAEGRAWITADESARREHELARKEHLVSVLWVKRPKEDMSTAYQFAILATALLRFDLRVDHERWPPQPTSADIMVAGNLCRKHIRYVARAGESHRGALARPAALTGRCLV